MNFTTWSRMIPWLPQETNRTFGVVWVAKWRNFFGALWRKCLGLTGWMGGVIYCIVARVLILLKKGFADSGNFIGVRFRLRLYATYRPKSYARYRSKQQRCLPADRSGANLYDMTQTDTKTEATQAVEAVKLLADWAKWLVAIETTAIAVVAFVATMHDPYIRGMASVLASGAVFCFASSVIAATLLLRSLPGIMQTIKPGQNIWDTEDAAGLTLGCSTSALMKIESTFFGIGLLLVAAILILKIMVWP